MERKYLANLLEWMNDEDRKPLMVWGARQVGKTYLIEELFAKVYFKGKYLRIDLSDDNDFVDFVTKNDNLNKTLEYIELHYDFTPNQDHLLFFDEAQECPAIIKMMKQFCEKRRDIPLIVSGSLVRIKINRDNKKTNKRFLFPVGEINQLYVFPLTFDEFLLNFSKRKYDFIKKHFEDKTPIDAKIHEELMDDFRTYLFVGGMPEVCDVFLKNKEDKIRAFKKVEMKIKEIYDDYLDDMSLYQTSTESTIRSRLIYRDIYRQLNKENKNFKVSQTIDKLKNRDVINPLFWLTTANVVYESWNLKEKITVPLMKEDDSLYRIYLSDMGMFTYQSGLNAITFLKDKDNALSGVYYENYVAIELSARRIGLFYWKGKRNHEMEFVIDEGGAIIPIDVKKGRDSLGSLVEFRNHNKNDLAIKISSNQYGYDKTKKILTLPFYYLPFYLDKLCENGYLKEDENC